MTNPSLSGRGSALRLSGAVPRLVLSSYGAIAPNRRCNPAGFRLDGARMDGERTIDPRPRGT